MQGSNRAKLHIFFHLTTLKPNYYVFSEIKIVLYHIKTHICALRTHLRPNRKKVADFRQTTLVYKKQLFRLFSYFTSFQSSVRNGTAGTPKTFLRFPGAKLRNE